MGGPCVRAIAKHKRGASKSRRASPKALVNECSKQLESLNEIALNQIKDGSPNGIVVEYRQLPEVSPYDFQSLASFCAPIGLTSKTGIPLSCSL